MPRPLLLPLAAVLLVLAGAARADEPMPAVPTPEIPMTDPAPPPRGLTAIDGITVGHHTRADRPTGVTVVVLDGGMVTGVDVRGGAPGTRETALLDPVSTVSAVHAIVLAGGSAFGLAAADGAVRWLAERGVGHATSAGPVPIVPAAILFDLAVGDAAIRPTAEDGYRAAAAASTGTVAEGSVGAGAGATVGKLAGMGRAMKGGIGTALVERPDGLQVAALAAVNAVGDVVDPADGRLVAGVRTADGRGLTDVRRLLRRGEDQDTSPLDGEPRPGEATTLVVVATNARLSKAQVTKVAQMAHDGLARAIVPAHTPYDGDTVFAVSSGRLAGDADVLVIGALAADAVAEAVLRAVRAATPLPGLPSASSLHESP